MEGWKPFIRSFLKFTRALISWIMATISLFRGLWISTSTRPSTFSAASAWPKPCLTGSMITPLIWSEGSRRGRLPGQPTLNLQKSFLPAAPSGLRCLPPHQRRVLKSFLKPSGQLVSAPLWERSTWTGTLLILSWRRLFYPLKGPGILLRNTKTTPWWSRLSPRGLPPQAVTRF